MEEKELDLSHVNEIDMECSVCDDDDDSFNLIGSDSNDESSEFNDVRSPVKTGIILDFSDDSSKPKQKEKLKVVSAEKLNTEALKDKNVELVNQQSEDFEHVNEIDMETFTCEDDDDDDFGYNAEEKSFKRKGDDFIDFSDNEDEDLDDKELVLENELTEKKKKKKLTPGQVEDDYWKNLSKKHAATNVKGAYNTSFHFAGNPKKEADIFNHMMGSDGGSTTGIEDTFGATDAIEVSSSSLGAEGISTSGESGATAVGASGGEGCSESLNTDYSKKLKDIFDVIGFEIIKNSDGSFLAIDTCEEADNFTAESVESLVSQLMPYIEDCFIYPLQIRTNQKFTTCKDWVNWYTDANKEKFPKIADDIEYCDVLANHLNDCKF